MYYFNFALYDPKVDKATVLFLYVPLNQKRIKISTRQKIHPRMWDFTKKKVVENLA